MEEIWRNTFISDKYQVSNLGNIKSLNYNWSNEPKLLKPQLVRNYLRVNISGKQVFLHKLVAFAFPEICGEWFEGAEVNHKDENPLNNEATNLEWCTRKYNNTYGTKLKRMSQKMINRNDMSMPIFQYDLNGNFIKEWPSEIEIKRQLGYNNSNISACCLGKQKTAYGYIWKYKKDVI